MLIYIREEDTGGKVFNELGDVLYRFERKTGFLPGYWIYQEEREIGTIRMEFGTVSKFGIIIRNQKKDIISFNPLDLNAGMKFERCLWRITGDFKNGSIRISDSRKKEIALVSRGIEGITVKLEREKDLYMVIMAWMAARMAA